MKRLFVLTGAGVRLAARALGAAGRATIALVGICGVVVALANYTMTQGAGTNFGSIVVSTVHYAQQLLCDSVAPAQCVAVSAAGAAKVDGSAVTQPVSAVSLPLPSGAATAALQPTNAAQGSTTSGQTGHLVECAVTAAAPTYTTAQTNPLSCDTNGNVRVNVTNTNANVGNNVDAVAPAATTASPVVNYNYGYNGTTWDRLQVDALKNLKTAPQAGELHIGETASNQIKVQVSPATTIATYATGRAVGSLMTVAGAARVSGSAGAAGTGGILTGLTVVSKVAQTAQMDIFLFDASPASTCTDNTLFVLATGDFDKLIGVLTIPATAANGAGWYGAATPIATVGIPTYYPVTYDLAAATSIFACAVTRGAPAFTSIADVSYKFNFLRN